MVSKHHVISQTRFKLLLTLCFVLLSVECVNLNGIEIDRVSTNEDSNRIITTSNQEETSDEPSIISESRNITVYSNETVQLACLVRKSPNTIVIWNQCEDASCNHLRNPLTINKDNFIEDLRFRVLTDLSPSAAAYSAAAASSDEIDSEFSSSSTTVRVERAESSSPIETRNDLTAWNLEIRKFGKNDEACYQCQLNSFTVKTIHYCLKLQTRVTARPKKVQVRLNSPIRLKCFTDENVRLSQVKWLRNGHRIIDEANLNDFLVEKKFHNDHIYSSLYIKHAKIEDAGVYLCKFGHLSEKIYVDVVIGDEKIKSAEIRSNQEDESDVVPSISQSISDAMFSSSYTVSPTSFSRFLAILFTTLFSLWLF